MKNTIIFIFSILLLIACQPATSTPMATLHESLRGGPDRDPLAIKESATAARTTDLAEASAAAPTPFTPPPPTATDSVPTATTPPGAELFAGSIELEYDLYWQTNVPGDLMHFDHELQEMGCIVGKNNDCQFPINGSVFQYSLNEDSSKIIIYWALSSEKHTPRELSLIDLEQGIFKKLDETEPGENFIREIEISPDGKWAAYKTVHLETIKREDGSVDGHVHSVTITPTNDNFLQGYHLFDCCHSAPPLIWSPDSTRLAWQGVDHLRVAQYDGDTWTDTIHFEDSNSFLHPGHGWSRSSGLLTYSLRETSPDGLRINGILYVVNPENSSYVEIGRSSAQQRLSLPGWVAEDKLASVHSPRETLYTSDHTLNIIELSRLKTTLSQETTQYDLTFEDPGYPYMLIGNAMSSILFGRITHKQSDNSYWIESYAFDEASEELSLIASCLSDVEMPLFKEAVWTPNHDLLFSDQRSGFFILSSNGPGCLDLNDLLGEDIFGVTWAP